MGGIKDRGQGCTLSHLGFNRLTRPKSFHPAPEPGAGDRAELKLDSRPGAEI
jgi:hypothetical protein